MTSDGVERGMKTLVKFEYARLPSRCKRTNALLYPGVWELTWVKPPHMPWVLTAMKQAEPRSQRGQQ